MTLRIFADWLSQPSRAVIWMARLADIPHEVVETRIAKLQHRSPAFAAVNPTKQVPAIQEVRCPSQIPYLQRFLHPRALRAAQDDGFCLSESAAILAYLAGQTEAGRAWYPVDPRIRARVDQALHWYHGCGRRGRRAQAWPRVRFDASLRPAPATCAREPGPTSSGLHSDRASASTFPA